MPKESEPSTWAEKLGFPSGKKVLILHADDAGMCEEANIATMEMLEKGVIQSAAAMPPCPNFEDMIAWAVENPKADVGLHLTLTSEWKTHRWGTVAPAEEVPTLLDPDGKMWHGVPDVVAHVDPVEVEKEIRAQIEKSIALGYRPNHIDTHMGSLYGSKELVKIFFDLAQEYKIPANVIELSNPVVVEHFRKEGYPIDDEVVRLAQEYTLPKVDFFTSAPKGGTYEEKIQNFMGLVKMLPPGLTEIIFHPSTGTENLKSITGSWQQRIWEYEMFSDPYLIQFFEDEGIIFTNWKEIMKRFEEKQS
jgi:predicted glycoside hydrolase/deacetylase ChbG (UPF0249 family)